jgi:hypothetical protein
LFVVFVIIIAVVHNHHHILSVPVADQRHGSLHSPHFFVFAGVAKTGFARKNGRISVTAVPNSHAATNPTKKDLFQ